MAITKCRCGRESPPCFLAGLFVLDEQAAHAARQRLLLPPPATAQSLAGLSFLLGRRGIARAIPGSSMAATNPHTIDRWDYATGENLIEQIAGDGDYLVALATNRAAVKRWPKGQDHAGTGRGPMALAPSTARPG